MLFCPGSPRSEADEVKRIANEGDETKRSKRTKVLAAAKATSSVEVAVPQRSRRTVVVQDDELEVVGSKSVGGQERLKDGFGALVS